MHVLLAVFGPCCILTADSGTQQVEKKVGKKKRERRRKSNDSVVKQITGVNFLSELCFLPGNVQSSRNYSCAV